MLSINTNLSSLIAQSSLKNSTNILNTAVERMSTGYKINHASDNAANYSIATNMTTKIGAYQVAEDNALQGLEMMSTSLESLNQISDKLNRMRALAVQTQNGTYGAQSLSAMSAEANALAQEINRIYSSAEYDDIKLFGKAEVVNLDEIKMSTPKLNSMGFLQNVTRIDTTGMTTLASIDESTVITSGSYSISTPEELAKLARMANAGKISSGTFVLANDIDLSGYSTGEGWEPIGNASNFRGKFNGNGYTVSNLYINRSSEDYVGLFGNISSIGSVVNLRITNASVVGNNYVGIITGSHSSTNAPVKNCTVSGAVTGTNYVGGVIGYAYRSVSHCYANINVDGESYVGGITGMNVTGITDSYVEGQVSGNIYVGGCIGSAGGTTATISGNYVEVTVVGNEQVGGVIGATANTITLSSNISIGSVTGELNAGGICGKAYNTKLIDNISLSNVYGKNNVGGITGYLDYVSVIDNCKSYGSISGEIKVGGIIGDSNNTAQILNSHTSSIVNGQSDIGIIAGKAYKVENCTYKANSARALVSNADVVISDTEALVFGAKLNLQVGVVGENSSQVNFNTYFDIEKLTIIQATDITSNSYISNIDSLMNEVSLKQTELGTGINRLESVLEEISTQYENLVSSRSTLRDVDIAEVSSEYIRQQILQQASATLMSTANQSPSIALQLI